MAPVRWRVVLLMLMDSIGDLVCFHISLPGLTDIPPIPGRFKVRVAVWDFLGNGNRVKHVSDRLCLLEELVERTSG
jgi:hypothetical protein